MVKWLKLKWKQFFCSHHWHKVVGGNMIVCAFYNSHVRAESFLCCKCAKEGDAYDGLGGL